MIVLVKVDRKVNLLLNIFVKGEMRA